MARLPRYHTGDGELEEGIVWEAAMCAPKFGLSNLIAIVDNSGERSFLTDRGANDTLTPIDIDDELIRRAALVFREDVHGNGANMDNFETHDERRILPNTCFSVEPGIYLPEFGVRSEINMMIRNGKGEVTGRVQNELVQI